MLHVYLISEHTGKMHRPYARAHNQRANADAFQPIACILQTYPLQNGYGNIGRDRSDGIRQQDKRQTIASHHGDSGMAIEADQIFHDMSVIEVFGLGHRGPGL